MAVKLQTETVKRGASSDDAAGRRMVSSRARTALAGLLIVTGAFTPSMTRAGDSGELAQLAWARTSGRPPARSNSPKRVLLAEAFPREIVERFWIADYAAIDQGTKNGWLIDIPMESEDLGVRLRTRGSSPVGEKEHNPELRRKLYRLARPAAALLFSIASQLREQEGERFKPLEVTSLVRPWTYQAKLMRSNPNADVVKAGVPPTHVLGLAFDLPRKDMSADRQRRLEHILTDLESVGAAIFFKEGASQSTFHVAALPDAFPELEREFERFAMVTPDLGGEEGADADRVSAWVEGD